MFILHVIRWFIDFIFEVLMSYIVILVLLLVMILLFRFEIIEFIHWFHNIYSKKYCNIDNAK